MIVNHRALLGARAGALAAWLAFGLAMGLGWSGCSNDADSPTDGAIADDTAGDVALDSVAEDGNGGPVGDADTAGDGAASFDAVPQDVTDLDSMAIDASADSADAPAVSCGALDCDDGTACTIDACDPSSGCVHLPVTCMDGDPCTIDGCDATTGCTFQPFSCDDGETCTEDVCYGNGQCANLAPECVDDNECTIDTCESGECAYLPVLCDDGDVCTIDTCDPVLGCQVDPVASACCNEDAECNDNNSCSTDICVDGLCTHGIATPGLCCLTDSDCTSESVCQLAFCANYQCQLVAADGEGCCQVNDQCDDGDPCTDESCVQNSCVSEFVCCVANDECDDGDDVCSEDLCLAGNCVGKATGADGCCVANVYDNGFEDGSLQGFTFENDSAFAGVGWKLVPSAKAKEGIWVLYYGNPVTQNYSTGTAPNSGIAKSPPLPLPVGVRTRLEFQMRLETELGTYADRMLVRVVELKGNQPVASTLIWTKKGFFVANNWVALSLPLWAWAGKTIRIEFDFDTFDAAPVNAEGVFIDDLRVISDCTPLSCVEDVDCNDGLLSTVGVCIQQQCVYDANPLNCEDNTDCDDKNPCTSDVCGDYQCYNVAQTWCCNTDADCADAYACTEDKCIQTGASPFCSHNWKTNCCDLDASGNLLFCDDNNPCTLDSCPSAGQPCLHQPLAGCCETAADCDDGSPCTADLCSAGTCENLDFCCGTDDECDDGDDACTAEACVNGQCEYVLLQSENCCMESLRSENFDGSAPYSWTATTPAAPGVAAWQKSTQQFVSGDASIWFGNSATGTYEVPGQAVSGVLQSQTHLAVPILTFTTLSFRVWMGTEFAFGAYPNADFDRLTVWAQPLQSNNSTADGDPVLLWDSGAKSPMWWAESEAGAPIGPVWVDVDALDLTPWAGRSVRLQFRFDSKDEFDNDLPGVFIDDIRVNRTCGIVAPGAGDL